MTLNKDNFSILNKDISKWLNVFKEKYSENEIFDLIENFKDLKVLVIGEIIIDKYIFCEGLSKSSKDPILAFKENFNEIYIGGSYAICKHISGFSKNVSLFAASSEEFYMELFKNKNNDFKFVGIHNKSIINLVKTRFVDSHTKSKVFEYYNHNDYCLKKNNRKVIENKLTKIIKNYDLVIVADYGHGLIDLNLANKISENSHFLSVNTQANAGNRGFNFISKYKKADHICLAEHELNLEIRSKDKVEENIIALTKKIDCKRITITSGERGLTHFYNKKFFRIPAFTTDVVDRVGAGDAVLSLISLALFKKNSIEIALLLSGLVGSLAVRIIGNKSSIGKKQLIADIKTILK